MSLYNSIGIFSSARADLSEHEAAKQAHGSDGNILGKNDGDGYYAPVANGVTGGNLHDHGGPVGGGATIDHGNLNSIGTNNHAQIDTAITNSTNHIAATSAHGATGNILGVDDANALYAPIAKGVTNGDSHNHSGGDGATISHLNLDAIGSNSHVVIDYHLANNVNYGNGHWYFVEGSIADPPTNAELDGLISVLDKLYVVRDTSGGNIFLVYARDYNGGEFRYVKLTAAV